MCVGIPARITAVTAGALPMARVDVAGRDQEVCLAYLPDAQVGDFVLSQNGFAMQLLDPASAAESLAAFVELGVVVPSSD